MFQPTGIPGGGRVRPVAATPDLAPVISNAMCHVPNELKIASREAAAATARRGFARDRSFGGAWRELVAWL